MELLQLKYFCDAAQTENFSRTAEKFSVPVSGVSQSIKRLEKELENPLFTHSGNRVRLNQTGRIFYNEVKKVLDTLEEATYRVRNLHSREKIAINVHITGFVIIGAIEKFHRKYPQLRFVTSYDPDAAMQDFEIVVTDQIVPGAYERTEVMEENLVLAYSRKHFPQVAHMPLEEIGTCPFITAAAGSTMEKTMYQVCEELGIIPDVVMQSGDTFFFRRCVTLGLGIAIVPEKTWAGHVGETVAFRNIGPYKRKVYVYRKNNGNPYLQEFADLLQQEFAQRTEK
jgi:DNA-binding transcriptional LysR family regulator